MTTARDIVNRSLRLIVAVSPGQPIAADDAETTLTALNAILHRYDGLAHTDYTLDTATAFDDRHNGDVAYMLAYEISSEFGRDVPPVVAKERAQAQSRFAAAYQYADINASLAMKIDAGLRNMPSQHGPANYRSSIS